MALLPYKSTVTVPAASKDMTVLATVKAELNITVSTDDAYLAVLIQQASSKAVELSGREFSKETIVDTFWVDECDAILQLTRWPIVSVTSVVEDDVTLTASDYEIIADSGWLRRIDSDGVLQIWMPSAKVIVTYDAGWVLLTNESHALERIVIDEIKRNWFARERDPMLRSIEVPGVLSKSFWVNTGGSSEKDPMLTALEIEKFVISHI